MTAASVKRTGGRTNRSAASRAKWRASSTASSSRAPSGGIATSTVASRRCSAGDSAVTLDAIAMQRSPAGSRWASRSCANGSSPSGWRRIAVPSAVSSKAQAAGSRRSIVTGARVAHGEAAWIASAASVRPLPAGPVMVTPAGVGAMRRISVRTRSIAALSPSRRAGSAPADGGDAGAAAAPRRIAPSTRASRSALRHGFIVKSRAPACIAATAMRIPLWAVSTMTQADGSSAMIRARQARPCSPLDSPGVKLRSSRIAS